MSSIRVRYGMAEVELEAIEGRTVSASTYVHYRTDDLIAATAQALTAAGDGVRADALRELLGEGVGA